MAEADAVSRRDRFPAAVHGASGCELAIVSHKTRHPFLRRPTTICTRRRAAGSRPSCSGEQLSYPRIVFFELTKQSQARAASAPASCTHFIDDLPEILRDPAFPATRSAILFDPKAARVRRRQRPLNSKRILRQILDFARRNGRRRSDDTQIATRWRAPGLPAQIAIYRVCGRPAATTASMSRRHADGGRYARQVLLPAVRA